MKIKLVLSDFDGTITQTDVLDMICELVGKGAASQHINNLFVSGQKDGKEALIERFSLLEGLELSSIYEVLEKVPLSKGADEFFSYTAQHGIKTLILSGNADFVLEYYGRKLHFSRISGSTVWVREGVIQPWDPAHCTCVDKRLSALAYIEELGVQKEEIIAIGDSIADRELFDLAGTSFLINRKCHVRADYEIDNLCDIIPHLMKG